MLTNGVRITNLLNNPLASRFVMNLDFFLKQTSQFDKSINLSCQVLVTLGFLLSVLLLQMI